jgi:transposase
MRKSFDSLRGIIRSAMHLDPLSGGLFLFKNKRGDRIKIVYWDFDGCATRGRSNMNGIKMPREPPFPVLT